MKVLIPLGSNRAGANRRSRPLSAIFGCVLVSLMSFILIAFPLESRASDQQLIEAINAVMMGDATPAQQALIVFKNRQINQLSIRGRISDAAYQASQKHFTDVNNSLIHDAAGKGGLRAKLQPGSGGKFNAGTDTDVLVEGAAPGSKINLKNIQATEDAYQQNLRGYLKRRGIDPPPGKINTDTDFMPTRASVTDEEFTRINEHINANGGTAYTRPGAAEVEFQMRTAKSNPGQKLNLSDTGDYMSEMHDLADHKFKLADDWEARANKMMASDPDAAEGLLADAQLARSQGSKYLQRMEKVTNAVADQHGLPPTKNPVDALGRPLSRDSLDSAVENISKSGRGVATAEDAALVGELGQLGIGKGLRDYVEMLSHLAANKPSSLPEIQVIIAEQAASLSPSLREALILRSVKAYQAAGGTPVGKDAFAQALVHLVDDPAARATARAKVAAGKFEVPEGVAATARVVGGVGAVLTVATVYLDYQACIDSGKTKEQCDEELKHTLKTTAIIGGGLFVGAKGLIAAGLISEATLAAVGAGLTFAGVPFALYAAYYAGINWANAPEKNSMTRQYAMEKDLLMNFGKSFNLAQAELSMMQTRQIQAAGLCLQLRNRAKATLELSQLSEQLALQWSSALGAKPKASDSCEGQGERMGRIFELAKQSGENETKVIQLLDDAGRLGEHCTTAAQAEQIRQLMETSNSISAQMLVSAAEARGYNSRIGHQDEAEQAQRLAAAKPLKARFLANKEHLATQSSEMHQLQDVMQQVFVDYQRARSVAMTHIATLSSILPKTLPSPLYQLEFFQANAQEDKLTSRLKPMPEALACPAGETAASNAIAASLLVTQKFDELEDRHNALRDETNVCTGVERQDKSVDDMDASANWVQAAVEINSPLLQKADACQRKSKPLSTASQCPANASPVWSDEKKKNLCQCSAGFKLSDDKKLCVPKNEPVVVACNTTTKAGSNPPQTIVVNVGRVAGTALFQYQMFDVPDHMLVQYGGQTLADTGCVSGSKSVPLNLSGASEQVTIVVQPACRKSERTEWNFSLSCPSADKVDAAGNIISASNSSGSGNDGPSQFLLETVSGPTHMVSADASNQQPLNMTTGLMKGALIQTGSNGQAVFKSPQETRVTMNGNTQIRLGGSDKGQQTMELQQGALDVNRRPGLPGKDDVLIATPDGTVQATGTRYRVKRDDRGTEVFVLEGSVHLTGRYIIRTYAANIEAGKPSPVREMSLSAGEQALIVNTDFSSQSTTNSNANAANSAANNATTNNAVAEVASTPSRWSTTPRPLDDRLAEAVSGTPRPATDIPAATSGSARPSNVPAPAPNPLNRPDPWNDAQVQNLMDQWLRTAIPNITASRPGNYSYTEWGQIRTPGVTILGAPNHPKGWSRYQSMWAVRMKFDSTNLCTLGEFVERQIAGRPMDGCQKTLKSTSSLPTWLAPAAKPVPAVNHRAEEALTLARTEVNRAASETQVAPDFSGDWGCDVREGADISALYPNIKRVGNTYTGETVTSGMEGLLTAQTVRLEGDKLIMIHALRLSSGSLTLSLISKGSTLTGTYQENRPGTPVKPLPIENCQRMKPEVVSPPVVEPKVSTLLDQIAAIPNSEWVGTKPVLGGDGRAVFALVAEVQDSRIRVCANLAKSKGWNVVGFSSRPSLQAAQYSSPPAFPLILSAAARDMIYKIHWATGRRDVPIPFTTAYLIEPNGQITRNGLCDVLVGIDFGIPEGRK